MSTMNLSRKPGQRRRRAGYYETTMKDGTQYHMIRVTYESGQGAVTAPVHENVQSVSEMTGATAFLWMVWGHCSDTDRPVYQPDEVPPRFWTETEGCSISTMAASMLELHRWILARKH